MKLTRQLSKVPGGTAWISSMIIAGVHAALRRQDNYGQSLAETPLKSLYDRDILFRGIFYILSAFSIESSEKRWPLYDCNPYLCPPGPRRPG